VLAMLAGWWMINVANRTADIGSPSLQNNSAMPIIILRMMENHPMSMPVFDKQIVIHMIDEKRASGVMDKNGNDRRKLIHLKRASRSERLPS
jgi:hypothetical protein